MYEEAVFTDDKQQRERQVKELTDKNISLLYGKQS